MQNFELLRICVKGTKVSAAPLLHEPADSFVALILHVVMCPLSEDARMCFAIPCECCKYVGSSRHNFARQRMPIEKWVSKQGEDEFGESSVASAKVLEEEINSRHRYHCISLEDQQ